MSPWRVAVGYTLAGALAVTLVVLPMTPLWNLWFGTRAEFAEYAARTRPALIELFGKEGPAAVAAAVRSEAAALPDGQFIVLADPERKVLSGTLSAWPAAVPNATVHALPLWTDPDSKSATIVVWHDVLPGGYHLLMGRNAVRTGATLLHGAAGAIVLLILLGAGVAWVLARDRAMVRRSEERYSRALQASNDGIWEWNLLTDEIFLSERARQLYAVPDGAVVRTRSDLMRVGGFQPDDRPVIDATVGGMQAKLEAGDACYDMEYRIVHPGGELRWLRSQGKAFPGGDGKIALVTGALTDITERKRADMAMRQSEQRYALAMEAAADGHMDWNFETGEFYISSRMKRIVGHPPDATFADRADWVRRFPFHPEDRKRWEEAVAAHYAGTDAIFKMDLRAIVNGETRWLAFNFIAGRDAAGKVVRWTGSITDIDDRKRAGEALRESQERYALALEAAEEGHFDNDLETNQIFVSARTNEIYGFPRQATVGNRFEYLAKLPIHPDDRHIVDELSASDWVNPAGDLHEIECRIVPRPGEIRWIHSRAKVVRDAEGRPRRRVGVVADITDRKLAEESLRLSEERYALAVAGASDGIWDEDYTTDMLYRSPRNQEIALGRTSDGVDTRPRSEWEQWHHIHPEDAPKRDAALRAHLDGHAPHYEVEYRARHPDGTYHWIHARGLCTRDASGRPLRIAGSTTNIDARKAAEEALRGQTERLQLGQAAMRMIIMDWSLAEDRITWSDSPEWLRGPLPENGSYPLFKEQVHPEDRDRFLASRQRALDTLEVQTTEFRLMRTNGDVIWVLERKYAISGADGKAVRMLAAMVDITDRKRAEDALRESQDRFARAVAGSTDGIWDIDFVGRSVYFSPRTRELCGLPAGPEVVPLDGWFEALPLHPEDLPRRFAAVQAHLSGKAPAYDGEFRFLQPDGVYRWRHLHGVCVRDADGKPLRMAGSMNDVDDRRRAEEGLRDSEKRYERVMLASEAGFWDWNVVTDEFHVSAKLPEMIRVPPGTTFANRADFMARAKFHPDDRASWEQAVQDLFASGGERLVQEIRSIYEGDETRWHLLSGLAVRDAAGKVIRWTGSVIDITERKRAEQELRDSEARFRGLTTTWSDWYWEQDENLRFTFTSGATANPPPPGYPGGQAVGRKRWELDDIVPISSTWEEHRALVEARKAFRDFEYSRPMKDGTLTYIATSGTPIFDEEGRFRGYHGTGRNITERKRAEAALRESERRYERAMIASRAGYWDWDLERNEYYLSPAMLELSGFPPGTRFSGREDFMNRTVWHTSEERESYKQAVRELLAGDGMRLAREVRLLIDGEIRWVNMEGMCVRDASGKVTRWTGFATDVTPRKRAEEDLRRMEERLRLAQRLESIGTLAGGIAHDFNNILGAIVGYGEMALRGVKEGTRQRRDLEAIMAAGDRGRALVDRILAFSRSGVGERIPVNVESVVREVLDQVAAKLPGSVTIKPRLRAGRAAMLGDSTQVHQVVMNLASNAVQAMPRGGTLQVDLWTERFDTERPAMVGSIAPGEYILLAVSDTGTGIAPDVLERMFDPFFTTKEVGVGSGLGLSLVHGIVASAGGAIDVTTEPGKGSTFTVSLPRSGDAAEIAVDADQPLPRGDGQRVLVVDDEESLVHLAGETLEDLGYAAVTFTSSVRALEAFNASPGDFDAILTDERMPGVSGSALIREMRRIKPSIPIVLMSGFVGTLDARELGADDVLRKPLHARDLANSFARVLGAR